MERLKSYSRKGEDLRLYEALRHAESHHYVDIGANHPIRHNNTYLFYTLGWNGILVDPIDYVFPLYAEARPRDAAIRAAIGYDDSTECTFNYVGYGRGSWGECSGCTLGGEKQEYYTSPVKRGHDYDPIKIRLININELLSMMPDVSLLSIDTEGWDSPILRAVNYDKFRPTAIIAETDKPQAAGLNEFMAEHGYEVYDAGVDNTIYRLG